MIRHNLFDNSNGYDNHEKICDDLKFDNLVLKDSLALVVEDERSY